MTGPIQNFTQSDTINEKFHDLVPGGSHTYSKGEDQFPYRSPKIMARAEGAYCWDVDNNRYIDWAMGNRVVILGHGYPSVNEAVKHQIDLGLNFTRPGILECELAEYLINLFPAAEMIKFGKNGSDVTTAAVRLARAYTGRKYIACCSDHPFFSTHDWFIGTTPMNVGIPDEVSSTTLAFHYNDMQSVEALFDKYPGKIAAVILEPVKNDAPRNSFLQKIREITQKEGSILIFDEIISGIRFDIRGAHHIWAVYPDLVCFGKCISNGFSFALLAGRREIMELGGIHHDKRRVFLLSQTHSSETVGLAACKATFDECIKVDVTDHIWSMGKKLVDGVRGIARAEGVSENVRVIGFNCNPQILCCHNDGTFWPELHTSFHEEVISHGVLIPWISITYSHREKELNFTLDALFHGIRKVKKVIAEGEVERSFSGEAVKPVFRSFNRCQKARCGILHSEEPKAACCTE